MLESSKSPGDDITSQEIDLFHEFADRETSEKDLELLCFLKTFDSLVSPEKLIPVLDAEFFETWYYLIDMGISDVRKIYFKPDYLSSSSKKTDISDITWGHLSSSGTDRQVFIYAGNDRLVNPNEGANKYLFEEISLSPKSRKRR